MSRQRTDTNAKEQYDYSKANRDSYNPELINASCDLAGKEDASVTSAPG